MMTDQENKAKNIAPATPLPPETLLPAGRRGRNVAQCRSFHRLVLKKESLLSSHDHVNRQVVARI